MPRGKKLLGELQLQLEPNAYHTWLHDTWVEGYEDGEFFIGTPNTYTRDWLENRLRPLVNKTLKSIVGRSVDVKFLVRTRQVKDAAGGQPLLHPWPGAEDSASAATLPAARTSICHELGRRRRHECSGPRPAERYQALCWRPNAA